MCKIKAIWLVFFKGYSVIKFDTKYEYKGEKEFGACNRPLAFDYCHDGVWGEGDSPFEAVINCHRKVNATKKIFKVK
jgi:hypothetical protein